MCSFSPFLGPSKTLLTNCSTGRVAWNRFLSAIKKSFFPVTVMEIASFPASYVSFSVPAPKGQNCSSRLQTQPGRQLVLRVHPLPNESMTRFKIMMRLKFGQLTNCNLTCGTSKETSHLSPIRSFLVFLHKFWLNLEYTLVFEGNRFCELDLDYSSISISHCPVHYWVPRLQSRTAYLRHKLPAPGLPRTLASPSRPTLFTRESII